jgi:hypothetical protein
VPIVVDISRVTAIPIARAPSPGPPCLIFTNPGSVPDDHPRLISGVPLANIPLEPITPVVEDQEGPTFNCPETTLNTNTFVCWEPTRLVCEHTAHHPANPVPICYAHDTASRRRIEDLFRSHLIAQNMRRFACEECCAAFSQNPTVALGGLGYRVYDGLGRTDFDPTTVNGNGEICGGLYKALPVTGCSCATKLIDRILCSAHRFEGFLALWDRIQAITQFAARTRVLNACFACGKKESIIVGPVPALCKGAIGQPKAYICAVCEGVVISVLPDDGYAWIGGDAGFTSVFGGRLR